MAKFVPVDLDREQACAKIAREAAAQGIVLFKNEGKVLPFKDQEKIAVFGIGQVHTIKGGTGSGEVNNKYNVSFLEGLQNSPKIVVDAELAAKYEAFAEANPNLAKAEMLVLNNNCNPEMPVEPADYAGNDVAVYVISRIAGEGTDVKDVEGQFRPTAEELALLGKIREAFQKVVVILNLPGVMEVASLDKLADAVVFSCLLGQEGGNALADVLTGVVAPSGKTTDSWAFACEDYISTKNFGLGRGNGHMNPAFFDIGSQEQVDVYYEEGVFIGYRYFDTFGKDVLYPFGFGLTYADLAITGTAVTVKDGILSVTAGVLNQDETFSGREVVQVYISAPDGALEKPYQELKGFGKTKELQPGEETCVTIDIPLATLASFDRAKAAYLLEPGFYYIRVGNSSRNTQIVGALKVEEEIICEKVKNLTEEPKDDFQALSKQGAVSISMPGEEVQKIEAAADAIPVTAEDITLVTHTYRDPADVKPFVKKDDALYSIQDVGAGKCTLEEFIAQMSDEELINLACGVGMDFSGFELEDDSNIGGVIGNVSLSVAGAAGESYDYTEKYGLKPMVLCDGPAGIRITRVVTKDVDEPYEQNCTAYPVGTVLADTWDPEVVEMVGRSAGREMVAYDVDLWLAPGMNIHRSPLCGRNFEYFSEDPLVAGKMAAAMSRGVQENNVGVTIKHFVCNDQEDQRTNSDSILEERTFREIYLKNFEIAVKEGDPWSIMSSYNDVNGVPAADNYETLTQVAREEWGFNGLVMTDWGGGISDAGISMFAGNDMIQPGGERSRNQIRKALAAGEMKTRGTRGATYPVTRAMVEKSVYNILKVYLRCPAFTGKLYA